MFCQTSVTKWERRNCWMNICTPLLLRIPSLQWRQTCWPESADFWEGADIKLRIQASEITSTRRVNSMPRILNTVQQSDSKPGNWEAVVTKLSYLSRSFSKKSAACCMYVSRKELLNLRFDLFEKLPALSTKHPPWGDLLFILLLFL